MCLILFQGADSMEKSKRKINNKRDLAYCEPEKKIIRQKNRKAIAKIIIFNLIFSRFQYCSVNFRQF